MGKLAEAYIEIQAKTKGFDNGIAASEKALMSFVGKSQSMLATIGAGLGVAGLLKFVKDAASSAGDLAETMSKVDQVFGKSKDSVMDLAEGMATQFGSARQTTLDAAAMFGLIAQGAKLGERESAALSTRLVKLADDASSFYNTPLDVALEKIRSGLVGESEPLRAFGVMLSEAAVQQKALSMGLATTTKDLTEQEKVLARVELITEGLAKAQGDHARTMGSYANQIKKLQGEWSNFMASVGSGFAEILTPELGRLNQMIGEARREGGGTALLDYLVTQFKAEPGSIAGDLLGERIRAAKERLAGPFLPDTLEPLTRIPEPPAAAAKLLDAFRGGGFGALGMMGEFGQVLNAKAAAEMLREKPRGTSGLFDSSGFGSFAIQRSLEGPEPKAVQELQRVNEKLAEILDATKMNRPAQRPGVFPARRR